MTLLRVTLLVDQLPQAVRPQRKRVQPHAQRRQGVFDGAHQGCLGWNGAALTGTLGTERVEWTGRLDVVYLDRGHFHGRRQIVIEKSSGQ